MKTIKVKNTDFVSFSVKVVIPKWAYVNINNIELPKGYNDTISSKISFMLVYCAMQHVGSKSKT